MSGTRNPGRTQGYIDLSLGRFLSHTDMAERLLYAWALLRGMRRMGDDPMCRKLAISPPIISSAPFDLDLADAEHYMYARYLAASTGDDSVPALVLGSETAKIIKYATSSEKDLRTDPRFPVLPPSTDSISWGLRGAQDGLNDYKKAHGGKLGTRFEAIKINRSLITGAYGGLYPIPAAKTVAAP